VIAFIGTWSGRKRGAFLWRTFVDTVRSHVPNAELVMVADYAEKARGVTLLQGPSDAEVTALLQRSAVFCLPSVYEGFGIPYLEAMAAGSAIVATDNVGARHVLGDALRGQAVADAELGPSLVELLTDPERRSVIAQQGRERALAFSWDRVVSEHERAYHMAIRAWRPR